MIYQTRISETVFFSFILFRHWLWLCHSITLCCVTKLICITLTLNPARGQEKLPRGNSESFRLFVERVIFFCPFVRDLNWISLCSSEELTIFCIGIYMLSTHGRRPLQIKYKKLLCLCAQRQRDEVCGTNKPPNHCYEFCLLLGVRLNKCKVDLMHRRFILECLLEWQVN